MQRQENNLILLQTHKKDFLKTDTKYQMVYTRHVLSHLVNDRKLFLLPRQPVYVKD